MAIEDFFAGQRALHRSASDHRELADDNFMIEGIALAAKAAAVGRRDDPNVTRRNFQNLCERTMNVVGRLGRAPKRELLIRIEISHGRMLLHGEMRAALEEDEVFAHQIRLGEAPVHVPEFERDDLVQVAPVSSVKDQSAVVHHHSQRGCRTGSNNF